MTDNHTAIQHEFVRKCLGFFYGGIDENIDQNEYDGSEDDLREYAATINEGLGYDLDRQIAALTAERDELREALKDLLAWAHIQDHHSAQAVSIRGRAWAALNEPTNKPTTGEQQ